MQKKHGIAHYKIVKIEGHWFAKRRAQSQKPTLQKQEEQEGPKEKERWDGGARNQMIKPSVSYNENFRSQSQTSRQLVDQIWLVTKGHF